MRGRFPTCCKKFLDEDLGPAYQVFNAARGGASIVKEFSLLKEIALPLDPDIVILTFITNDIAEMARPRDVERMFQKKRLAKKELFFSWFRSKTAIGELAYRLYWTITFPKRKSTKMAGSKNSAGRNREIEGGMNFSENAANFLKRFGSTDGLVLAESFSAETQKKIDMYLEWLERFAKKCKQHNVVPMFAYHPAYSQVYDQTLPTTIQDLLENRCQELGMPFLNLTGTLRKHGKDTALHNAPVDYHLNAKGNKVIAKAMYDFLRAKSLVQ